MKLKILSTIAAVGLAASAYGQGVILDNQANNGGVGALTGGRVYIDNGTTVALFDGLTYNLGVTITAGPDAGSLMPVGLGTYTTANDPKGYTGANVGQFQLGSPGVSVNLPGVAAGGPAIIQLQMWYDGAGGLFPSFAAAQAGGGYTGTVQFANGVSNPGGQPPVPPPSLSGMPSVTLTGVPEPTTIALAGLGLAGFLLRRRK